MRKQIVSLLVLAFAANAGASVTFDQGVSVDWILKAAREQSAATATPGSGARTILASAGTSYSCHAYCGFHGNTHMGMMNWNDTNGRLVVGQGRGAAEAFSNMDRQCTRIDSKYLLYTSKAYTAWATPTNSCTRE